MSFVYNIVSTRCADGQHLALQAWYADHVQLLLACPPLLSAQLQRCTHAMLGEPPDYVCTYDFRSPEDFELFERSDEKAQAGALTDAAAGRGSIQIVQRRQYARLLHRRYGSDQQPSPQGLLMELHVASNQGTMATSRWLGAALQEAGAAMPMHAAHAYQSLQEPDALLLDVSLGACDARQAWDALHMLLQPPPLYGQAPTQWTMVWAASRVPVMQWLR
jgi:hypothetical protein